MISSRFALALNLAGMHESSQDTGQVDAVDVTFDPVPSGLVATNVQSAIDELSADINAITVPGLMTTSVAGTCYGVQNQDVGLANCSYGKLSVAGDRSMVFFNPKTTGVAQTTVNNNSILSLNHVTEGTPSICQRSNVSLSKGSLDDTRIDFSIVLGNDLNFVPTSTIESSTVIAEEAYLGNVHRSLVFVGQSVSLIADTLDRCAIFGINNETDGSGTTYGCTFIGGLNLINKSNKNNAVVLVPAEATAASVIDPGAESMYLGNAKTSQTLAAEELVIGDFTSFRVRSLPSAVKNGLVYYDTSTKEVTTADLTTTGTIGRQTRVLVADPAPSNRLFYVPVGNGTITKVSRGSATTDGAGYYTIVLSSFGFPTASDYSIIANTTAPVTGTHFTIHITKTAIDAVIFIEYSLTGSSLILAAPSCPFDFIISY